MQFNHSFASELRKFIFGKIGVEFTHDALIIVVSYQIALMFAKLQGSNSFVLMISWLLIQCCVRG